VSGFIGAAIAQLARIVSGATIRMPDSGLPKGQTVFFANHTSHLDFVTLWAAIPPSRRARTRPIAAKDYWDKPGVRQYLINDIFHAILVDRQGGTLRSLREQLDQMTSALDAGDSLIIFPEGTRGEGDTIAPFQAGLHALHRHCPDAHMIPVRLINLNRVLPKGEFIPVPLLSTIVIGEPLPTEEGESRNAFLKRAQHALIELGDQA